eukprot:CAMPEP_0202692060 /NCGR_PEP_ID=MMETSP1385-20130828/6547_1 /ASSEMBLY_ACC=CAM_ASM_000861 /TAXON_ID=933848 /ORGANISM="Elphidium margaritaceum" /LENGTH=206 /DNA_ID=CAMNT_0049347533 /DNA_START=38 /DNA_END=658 /DNA_ORIENTATION=-
MAAPKNETDSETKQGDNDDSKKSSDEDNNVKLVIYDFDQTITTIHLYHELNYAGTDQLKSLKKMKDKRLIEIFGGKDRIKALNGHFSTLMSNGVDIGIISYGYVDVIKQALTRMDLFKYFDGAPIIGTDSAELDDVFGSKAQCIVNQFQKESPNYTPKQIAFVDDDSTNISEAKEFCQTVLIQPRKGMNNDHMATIEQLAGIALKK